MHPLTNILVKIFARGFYKVHTGFLIFLFVIVISYCFFINTVGTVQPDQVLYYNFILLISFISSPIMTMVFFLAWFAYTVKSWYFISGQLLLPEHQFVFYSSNIFSKSKQFKSWFYTQFIISLPFVFYGLIAIITGVFRHTYIIPAIIILYILLLITISALLYVKIVNSLVDAKARSGLLTLSRRWRKPFISLFIYNIFDKLKVTYAVTKLLSYLVITGVLLSFADVQHDARVPCIIILGIITSHAILIYQQHKFEQTYLNFARNFPYNRGRLYTNCIITSLLLIFPETIWLFINFNVIIAVQLLLLALGMAMLLHAVLYKISLAMNKYLPWVLGIFVLQFWLIMFGLMSILIPLNLLISFMLYYNNYYKYQVIIK